MVLEKTEIYANMGEKERKWVFQTSLLELPPSGNETQCSSIAGLEKETSGLAMCFRGRDKVWIEVIDQFLRYKSNKQIFSWDWVGIGTGDEKPILEQENKVRASQKAFLFGSEMVW